jgi:hypothetical protein
MIGCAPTYTVEAPAFATTILAVLGSVSLATGVRFTVALPGTVPDMTFLDTAATDITSLGPVDAYYAGNLISFVNADYTRKERFHLVLHETLHWVGMGHNTRLDSAVSTVAWPEPHRLEGYDLEQARSLTSECRPSG